MKKSHSIIVVVIGFIFIILFIKQRFITPMEPSSATTNPTNQLDPEQDYIINQKGTEVPFSSPLYYEKRAGTYLAADTKQPVFRSEQKYESGTGWPSFWAPVSPEAIKTKVDMSGGLERTEVLSTIGGHLGHVFPDGPEPTGLRYCLNGDALIFIPDEQKE